MRRSEGASAQVPQRPAPRDPGRRQRILDVARRHFAERGFAGTRLDDVAAEAGCAKGTIYLEFDDKQTLLREVVDGTFARILEEFNATVVPLESPLARLRESLRFAFRQHRAEPLFGRLLRDDPELRLLRGVGDDTWKAAAAQRTAVLLAWVDEGIRLGEIRPDVDRNAVPGLIGVLRFAPQHLNLVAAANDIPAERVLDAVVDIFTRGLEARPTTPAGEQVRPLAESRGGQPRSTQPRDTTMGTRRPESA